MVGVGKKKSRLSAEMKNLVQRKRMTCTAKRLVFLTTVAWSNGYDISFTTDVNLIRDGSRFDPGRDYFFVFFLFLLNFCIFAACAIWLFAFI